MNSIINKYLVAGFLKTIFNFFLVFVCLGVILNLFEEIEFFKNLNIGLGLPFLLTTMFIPNLILIKLLPFIIFFSSMWFLLSIRTNSDLLSLKVFGYSNLKIIFILSTTAFLFGLVIIIAVNPVTSTMVKYYEKTKAKYSRDIDHLVSINKNGVWIKEVFKDKTRITTSKKLIEDYLLDVTIYNLNENNLIVERLESKKVNISDSIWVLEKPEIYKGIDSEKIFKDSHVIKSQYNYEKISSLYSNLDTISFFEIMTEYKILIDKGYGKELLNEKLNIFFSLPFFLFLMVVLASIFTIGTVNKSQNIYYIFISIITCVVIYYFKDLSIALGQTNRISLGLSVWMPIIAISLFCLIGIIQINEK